MRRHLRIVMGLTWGLAFAAIAVAPTVVSRLMVETNVSPQDSEWSDPVSFTTSAGGGGGGATPVWLPAAWEPNLVYESDLCFVMVTALDTLPESGTNEYDEGEFGPGPDAGEWHVVDFGSPSGYTSGGAVSGFTPARHISDDISGSAVPLDFGAGATGCAFEGRQDPASPPVGQGPTGGNGPPSPRLLFSQIPGAASSYTKVFLRVRYVLESAAMFGGEEWQDNSNGVKLFRVLCDGCGNSPQGMIVDMLNGTVISQGAGRMTICSSVHLSNVWGQWPSHAGDVLTSGNPCFNGTGNEGWTNGVVINYFACIDADPDHDGNPSDGDLAVLSHGYDEAEGIMMYLEPGDLTSAVDAGPITGVMNDNTWGGGGVRDRPFSKWLVYIEVWHGDGTSESCTVPPIAPWT